MIADSTLDALARSVPIALSATFPESGSQPAMALPRRALLSVVVDMDAEARRVSAGPFEIVQKGPAEVATHIDAGGQCPTERFQMGVDECDPLSVGLPGYTGICASVRSAVSRTRQPPAFSSACGGSQ